MKKRKTHNKPVIMVDFGGVYFTYASKGLGKFQRKFNLSEKQMLKIMLGKAWKDHATGRTDEATYWKHVAAKLKASGEDVELLKDKWYNHSRPKAGMEELVSRLKKKYRVAALSSTTAPWIDALEKKYRISKIFHDHHYSFDHGIDKPDAGIFLSAARRMNVKPEDCIVVDDMKKFLAAVKRKGAKTILFRNTKQLERDLGRLGVQA